MERINSRALPRILKSFGVSDADVNEATATVTEMVLVDFLAQATPYTRFHYDGGKSTGKPKCTEYVTPFDDFFVRQQAGQSALTLVWKDPKWAEEREKEREQERLAQKEKTPDGGDNEKKPRRSADK